jgi:hypothetical protein
VAWSFHWVQLNVSDLAQYRTGLPIHHLQSLEAQLGPGIEETIQHVGLIILSGYLELDSEGQALLTLWC